MDPVSDILRDAGLRRRLLDLRTLGAVGALRFPCERSMGFHVVVRGEAWLHADDLPSPRPLAAGDIALMARGCHHVLARARHLPAGAIAAAPVAAAGDTPAADDECVLVSGAYQFWNAPVHPLFDALPAWTVLPRATLPADGALAAIVGLLGAEAGGDAPGRETVLHGLLDAAFVYLLRAVLDAAGAARDPGWARAIGDPRIRRAIAVLHADPARDWTLAALARESGLSRSALALQFRATTGDTPLNYLRLLRVQRAMRLLGESNRPLESVAAEVGYRDAFGFSRAFKRVVGLPPSAFRRRDAGERHAAGRL